MRDLLMRLAVGFVFQPKWTDQIHDEWIAAVLRDRPDPSRQQLERTRAFMERWGRDWRVPAYEALIPTLNLPDDRDVRVLAAAIAVGVSVIVTFNLDDFPDAALSPHHIRAVDPDDYLAGLFEASTESFLSAARAHRAALSSRRKEPAAYLETLSRNRLPILASRLEPHIDAL